MPRYDDYEDFPFLIEQETEYIVDAIKFLNNILNDDLCLTINITLNYYNFPFPSNFHFTSNAMKEKNLDFNFLNYHKLDGDLVDHYFKEAIESNYQKIHGKELSLSFEDSQKLQETIDFLVDIDEKISVGTTVEPSHEFDKYEITKDGVHKELKQELKTKLKI